MEILRATVAPGHCRPPTQRQLPSDISNMAGLEVRPIMHTEGIVVACLFGSIFLAVFLYFRYAIWTIRQVSNSKTNTVKEMDLM